MARSFIDPSLVAMAVEPAAPPWNWNPGATFTQAFNDAQALQIKREEMENERQIMEILLPYKVKKAALDLEELKSDMKFNEASVDLRRQEIQYKNRALEETLKSRNRPRAIFNPSTGGFEPMEGGASESFGVDADEPLPPMPDEGTSSIFDDLEDTDLTQNTDQTGLSYRVSDQTRDQLGQKSTAQNRQVSLDFNAGGDSSTRGVEIVIPRNATPEERAAAEDYTNKLTAWYKSKGIDVPNRGVLTKTGEGELVDRFHTEPFFVQDEEARKAIESDPDGYANVLSSTLGRLPVTFIPPHTSKDTGAAGEGFNERDFARSTIIPALRRLQEGGRTETRTASATPARNRNPLLDEEDGFENPLAQLDEEAIVPIGAQYTGGENNMAAGRFDTELVNEEPASTAQQMGFDVEGFAQSVDSPEEIPDDERIVREIQAERGRFEQNVYDMRRKGFDISSEDLQMGYERIERKARAQLIPFISKLGEAGQASMKTLLDGKEPIESSYLLAKKSVSAAEGNQRPQGAPDNPTLKAAIDNLKNYKSTLADADVLTTRQAATLGALERQVELYTAVPQSSPIQDFVSAQSEFSSIQEAIRSKRPYARLTPGGDTEVIPFDELEPIAQEYQMRIDALAPRLREDPSVFNPMAYQREEDALAAKEQMLKENPDAFVITPKGEVSYLRNWNQVQEDEEENQPPAETTFPLLERGSRIVGQIARAAAPAARGYTASVAGAMRNLPASRAVEEAKNIKRIAPVVRGAASGFKRGFKGQPSK